MEHASSRRRRLSKPLCEEVMFYEYNQIDVAIAQLNAAICLFLDSEDYFSSATLAGAADEIFGNMLEDKGEKSALTADTDHLMELLTACEKDTLKTKKSERNGIINILNFQRNWLKHRNKENFTNYSDPKYEAQELIYRAVRNALWLKIEKTPSICRYLEHLTQEGQAT